MRKKHDKAIATALVIGYSSVFVIHPAVLGILFGSVLSPGRAFADESERIYQQIQNTYKTSPESIASENKLQEVQNKYSDNNESSDSSVTQSLSAKINSYATEWGLGSNGTKNQRKKNIHTFHRIALKSSGTETYASKMPL